jgi:hypothetical protein
MLISLATLLATLSSIFRSHAALQLENLALRHQIGVLRRSARKRPKLTSGDRLLWICLSRFWRDWRSALAIVKPEMVVPGIVPGFTSTNFSPTSVQLKSEINGAFPRKRHQKQHLEFCTTLRRTRRSGIFLLYSCGVAVYALSLCRYVFVSLYSDDSNCEENSFDKLNRRLANPR